jgi:hypothetical protein
MGGIGIPLIGGVEIPVIGGAKTPFSLSGTLHHPAAGFPPPNLFQQVCCAGGVFQCPATSISRSFNASNQRIIPDSHHQKQNA